MTGGGPRKSILVSPGYHGNDCLQQPTLSVFLHFKSRCVHVWNIKRIGDYAWLYLDINFWFLHRIDVTIFRTLLLVVASDTAEGWIYSTLVALVHLYQIKYPSYLKANKMNCLLKSPWSFVFRCWWMSRGNIFLLPELSQHNRKLFLYLFSWIPTSGWSN